MRTVAIRGGGAVPSRAGPGLRWRLRVRDFLGRGVWKPGPTEGHLHEAMEWLCRAQDATPDAGVSRAFHARQGWQPSYPETTGYIIPTFYDYAALTGQERFRQRARRMALWLLGEQLENGAMYGGTTAALQRTPTIFNTGMALQGLVRAYSETREGAIREAALSATRFLVESQDPDGAWRRYASRFAKRGEHVYHTRVAWALAEAGRLLGDAGATRAAERNIEWALTRQNDRGWFSHNDLVDDRVPLTHTIGYAARGILETSLIVGHREWIDMVRTTADALLKAQCADGSLPGRFDENWRPTTSWSCLTGCAQIAIVWFRLYEHTCEPGYLQGAVRSNRYLCRGHDIRTTHLGVRGAVRGSHPIYGPYLRDGFPNWAVKFFADSLMLELRLAG